MAVLCSRSSSYWNHWKVAIQIPLILVSSCMAILNSFSDDGSDMRVPNVFVNAVSVLLMSLNNSMKVFEKVESFRAQAQAFIELSHEIEAMETYAKVIDVFFELLWARVPITTCDDSIGYVGLNEVLQNSGARGRCGADAFD